MLGFSEMATSPRWLITALTRRPAQSFFVEQLYAVVAARIFIPEDTIFADEEELEIGGPYSDHWVIEFSGSDVPPALSLLYRAEATIEGWNRDNDRLPIIRNRFLLLWWD